MLSYLTEEQKNKTFKYKYSMFTTKPFPLAKVQVDVINSLR